MTRRLDLSVCIPMYKSAGFLPALFARLDAQDVLPEQVILLDDCSPDHSYEHARELIRKHPRLDATVLRNESNLGIAGTYNRLIELANHRWLQILDADDYPLPSFYARLAPLLDSQASAILAGMRSNSSVVSIVNGVLAPLIPRRVPRWLPMLGSFATRSGVIYRTSVVRQIKFPNPQFDGSDILHLQRVRDSGWLVFEERAQLFYRLHSAARSTSKESDSKYLQAIREQRLPLAFRVDFFLRRRALSFIRRTRSKPQ